MDFQRGEQCCESEQSLRYCVGGRAGDGGGQLRATGDRGAHNVVVALNVADGTRLWQSQLGKGGAPGWGGYGGPRSTPTIDSGLVFAVGQYGEVACLDAATGSVKWRKDCEKDFGGEL